ncbi:carbohydrate ABC transporter permease [Oribacterium parvum]|uniref:carbohydrate ABC transporter permease n=1 Tax=Oribacterium parvum TaxID=1501329 RepID=UPI0028E5D5E7|nr:carbohydrate ABC transporter permease [Oribacterium parvum]
MKKAILSKGIFVITIFLSLFWLMPLIFIFMNSFKGDAEIINHFLELPKEWTLRYYFATWNKFNFPLLLKNTVFYTVITTAMVILLAPMASYFLARRKHMFLSKISLMLLLLPIMVPFQTYMISLTKFLGGFRLIGTRIGYISVTVGLLLPLAVYIIYNYINTIPLTLEESAYIDGANIYQCYFYIILPLLRPILTTVLVLDALSTWNDVITNQLIVGTKMSSMNIQNALYMFFSVQSTDWSHALPGTMMSIIPSLLFFLIMQKYIVTGITAGAVKG